MKICKVMGTIVSTVKDNRLLGHKLLICQTASPSGRVLADYMVAVDCAGAGKGDTVLVVSGSPAQAAAGVPVDAAVIAIIDTVKLD